MISKKNIQIALAIAVVFFVSALLLAPRDHDAPPPAPNPTITYAINNPGTTNNAEIIHVAAQFQSMSVSNTGSLWSPPTEQVAPPISTKFHTDIKSVSPTENPTDEAVQRAAGQKYHLIYRPDPTPAPSTF